MKLKRKFSISSIVNFLSKNKIDIIFIIILSIISLYFLFWNLFESRLINGWEIANIREFNRPLTKYLSEGWDIGSNFYPFFLIIKLFSFFNSFPECRYITSFFTFLSVLLLYFLLRFLRLGKLISFPFSIIIPINLQILTYSRIFISPPITLFLSLSALFLYFIWERNKKDKFLILIFLFLGLIISNHIAAFYFVLAFLFWFIFLSFKKVIKIRTIFFCFVLFLLLNIPYLILLTKTSSEGFWYYFKWRYQQVGFEFNNKFYFSHIKNLDFFVDLLNGIWSISNDYFIIIFFIPIIIFLNQKNRDKDLKFLFYMFYSMFLFVLFSPVPFNIHYFFPFILVFIILIAKELSITKNGLLYILLIIFMTVIFFSNIGPAIKFINNNESEYLNQIFPKNYQKIAIEGYSYSILKYTNILNNTEFYVFKCFSNGIYSINDLKNYFPTDLGSKDELNPNFFIEKKLKRNDLIIFSGECIAYSRLIGLNVSDYYGLNNSYTNINFPIEFVNNDLANIIIYRVN